MGPALEIWIDRAEKRWLEVLYANAEALFLNRSLPSHDHTHHMRVWNLCKALLREMASFDATATQILVEGVLIAAFFHDLGMAYSTREDHGRLGKELCEGWFRDGDRKVPENFPEILRAIELHDRKEEQIYSSFAPGAPPEILGILAVADDLEAMGTIGIYRYAEIYLRRGIPLEILGERILANANRRFENLSAGCRLCGSILDKYRDQYRELTRFYSEYNLQLRNVTDAREVNTGPLGVINYIRTSTKDPGGLKQIPEEVKDYFMQLKHELEKARL